MNYLLYTDGACPNNGKENSLGGWAFVILDEEHRIVAAQWGNEMNSTNQRMELMAIIAGLQFLSDKEFFTCECRSDSAYCINGINNGWIDKWRTNGWMTSKKMPVSNRDLWETLYNLYTNDRRFTFKKIMGHAWDEWNDYVDKMAKNAAKGNFTF